MLPEHDDNEEDDNSMMMRRTMMMMMMMMMMMLMMLLMMMMMMLLLMMMMMMMMTMENDDDIQVLCAKTWVEVFIALAEWILWVSNRNLAKPQHFVEAFKFRNALGRLRTFRNVFRFQCQLSWQTFNVLASTMKMCETNMIDPKHPELMPDASSATTFIYLP